MAAACTLNDGSTAKNQEVFVAVDRNTLIIQGEGGSIDRRWNLRDLVNIDDPPVHGILRLRNQNSDGVRLTITDSNLISEIAAIYPSLFDSQKHWRGFGIMAALMVAGVLLLGSMFIFVLPRASSFFANLVPTGWELALGNRVSDDILKLVARISAAEDPVCSSKNGDQALAHLTERLGANAQTKHLFNVKVLDVGMVNAVALPGGHIFLFRGLLEKADSPNQVAGVLAHEMAHVIHRHGTEALIRETGLSIIFHALFGGADNGMGQTLFGMSYSRGAEREADQTAVALLKSADIDTAGLANFFRAISNQGADLPPGLAFLSTHPQSDARADFVDNAGDGQGDLGLDADQWHALRGICDV